MKIRIKSALVAALAAALAGGALVVRVKADDANDAIIKEVMKTYHKAPKGVDPVCKKAIGGQATAEELKKLVAGYKSLTTTKPPKGDEASWKEKTEKLYEAAQALEKGEADGVARYKKAVDCKSCHTAHKPD